MMITLKSSEVEVDSKAGSKPSRHWWDMKGGEVDQEESWLDYVGEASISQSVSPVDQSVDPGNHFPLDLFELMPDKA